MASSNKIQLRIVVSGTETTVNANENAPLRAVVERALAETHNHGRPIGEWELRDGSGLPLELDRTVESYNFAPGTLLYLQPNVGVNGSASVLTSSAF